MRGYADGMQKLTHAARVPPRMPVRAAVAVVLLILALPARADEPAAGWYSGSGVDATGLTVLRAFDDSNALAGGFGGVVMRTSDTGLTWSRLTPPGTISVRDLASADGQTIYALDNRGGVKRSADAGVSWAPISTKPATAPVAILRFGDNSVLAVGRRALALSGDGGDSFAKVTPKLAPRDILRAVDRAGAAVMVSGSRTLLVSTDGARKWNHMKLPPLARGDGLLAVDFTAPRQGFALSALRRLFRTKDAGHDWTELLGSGGAGTDLAFSDPQNGYLAAPGFANRYDGVVMRTSDGGSTWRPQLVAPRFLSRVAIGGGTAFALANEGSALFATRSGGDSGTPVEVGFRATKKRVRRGGFVTIRGRVTPPASVKQVVISVRAAGRWQARIVKVGSKAVFTSKFKLQRTSAFIAQVLGDGATTGAGTHPVFVRVSR